METILVLMHTEDNGTLGRPARECLAAARSLRAELAGSTLTLGLVGAHVQGAADSVAGCGADRILGVAGAAFGQSRYATDALAAEAVCREAGATLVVAPGTPRWCRTLPGVAYRLGGRADTHVTGLSVADGAVSIVRWYYRQRMEATIRRTQRPWVVVTDPGCVAPWEGAPRAAAVQVVVVEPPAECLRTAVTGFLAPAPDAQTIRPDADLLLVAGAGWTKTQPDGKTHAAEAAALILAFLRKTQASLGGSKSLVDISGEGQAVLPFMTHLNQVGQTGSTPRHPKGLATCCHGEEPHTVGWRFIDERRAVNLDPNCGWARGKADVLYVADAFAVMRKVNELLEEKEGA
jgi:electron transfer flavoprotein alpha subunit